jgi:DNA-binding transcriptional regulator YhcF (GntR family)
MAPDDSRPTYLQVADELRGQIRAGELAPGERLPSVRDLSVRLGIAAVTVQSALRVLRDEGLIVPRSTRGYFVRDELPDLPAPSPEYAQIRDQLAVVQATVEDLAERISHLEQAVLPAETTRPRARRARAAEPDAPSPPSAE